MSELPPVITIDGPSGSGKGTISQKLAEKLGWHFLDSGAIYRTVAWAVINFQVDPSDKSALKKLIETLDIKMQPRGIGKAADIFCNGNEITDEIRTEEMSSMASKISAIPLVRAALLNLQREMRKAPGLVTDGRDMGTVVFPDAELKFYLEAGAQERAKRRYKQLKDMGKNVSLREILEELAKRDGRDASRDIAPLKPAPDVVLIDTTNMGIDEVMDRVMKYVEEFI